MASMAALVVLAGGCVASAETTSLTASEVAPNQSIPETEAGEQAERDQDAAPQVEADTDVEPDTDVAPEAEATTVVSEANLRPVTGEIDFRQVIRSGDSYYGLGGELEETGLIPIRVYWSPDAVSWSAIGSTLDGEPLGTTSRIPSLLTTTGQGLSLVVQNLGTTDAPIQRLVSNDGVVWDVDPSIDPLSVAFGTRMAATGNGPGAMLVVRARQTPSPTLQALLENVATDFGEVCGAGASGGTLEFVTCDEPELVEVSASDLRQPELYDEFVTCLEQVDFGLGLVSSETVLVTSAGQRSVGFMSSAFAEFGSGGHYAFPSEITSGADACSNFAEIDERYGLVVGGPDNDPVFVPYPDEISFFVPFAVGEDAVITTDEQYVWRLPHGSTTWERIGEEGPGSGRSHVDVSDDGELVAVFDNDSGLWTFVVDTQQWVLTEVELDEWVNDILFVDSETGEVLLATDEGSLVVVQASSG